MKVSESETFIGKLRPPASPQWCNDWSNTPQWGVGLAQGDAWVWEWVYHWDGQRGALTGRRGSRAERQTEGQRQAPPKKIPGRRAAPPIHPPPGRSGAVAIEAGGDLPAGEAHAVPCARKRHGGQSFLRGMAVGSVKSNRGSDLKKIQSG